MPKQNFFDRPLVVPALFISLALLIGLWIVGWGIGSRGNDNTITTTGSASVDAQADEATWAVDLERTAYAADISSASVEVSNDEIALSNYFTSKHLASSSITTSVVSENENYSENGGPTSYDIRATVTVSSSDVNAINTLSHDIGDLGAVAPASIVSPEAPQYYVSNLPALRVSLLGQAVQDAKARAVAIAQSGGSSVGALASADSGVVQVLAPNSTNVEDDGEYDTSTIQKEISVTAHATFYVH